MADPHVDQRLAAILAADVAGYSRLMEANERATVASLDACRAVFREHVAAGLEGLAEPGGICLSGSAHEQVEGKIDLDFENIGLHEVKNIAWSVRVYRVRTEVRAPAHTAPDRGRRGGNCHRRRRHALGALSASAI